MSYWERVENLLAEWCLLENAEPRILELFRLFGAGHCALPDPMYWHRYSRLCSDGSPVEFCETVGPHAAGPTFTCDPGPYGAVAAIRRTMALMLASRAGVSEPILAEAGPGPIWLGVDGLRIKLYCTCETVPYIRESLRTALESIGTPKMSAFAIRADGTVSKKWYYRMGVVDLQSLTRIAGETGADPDCLRTFVRRVLGEKNGWTDQNAGVAAGTDGDLAIYLYTRRYFRDDAELRQRVLQACRLWGWEMDPYRAVSRLLDGTSRMRTLIGFALNSRGAAGIRLYSHVGPERRSA